MKINSSLSHRRKLESGLKTKGEKIPEKRVMKIDSSLSHRRTLKAALENNLKDFSEKN
jgi:hypothetical protein